MPSYFPGTFCSRISSNMQSGPSPVHSFLLSLRVISSLSILCPIFSSSGSGPVHLLSVKSYSSCYLTSTSKQSLYLRFSEVAMQNMGLDSITAKCLSTASNNMVFVVFHCGLCQHPLKRCLSSLIKAITPEQATDIACRLQFIDHSPRQQPIKLSHCRQFL